MVIVPPPIGDFSRAPTWTTSTLPAAPFGNVGAASPFMAPSALNASGEADRVVDGAADAAEAWPMAAAYLSTAFCRIGTTTDADGSSRSTYDTPIWAAPTTVE